MRSVTHDVFETNIFILKCAGLWAPNDTDTRFKKAWIISTNCFRVFYAMLLYPVCEVLVVKTEVLEMNELIEVMKWLVLHIATSVKLIVWLAKRRAIMKIMKTLQEVPNYEPVDDFYPSAIVREDKKYKKICDIGYTVVGCCVSASPGLAGYLALFIESDKYTMYKNDTMNGTIMFYSQKLPFVSKVPFDYTTSKLHFAAAVLFQFVGISCVAWIINSLDTLYSSLICYTATQLKILQGAFRTIRKRSLLYLNLDEHIVLHDSPQANKECMAELIRCIKHLQVIMKTSAELESILTYIILTQALDTGILVCSVLYLVSSISFFSKAFAGNIFFLMACEIQIGLFCYYGDKVTENADGIVLSLYQGDWLSASESFKKNMMFTMMRMRKALYFTIGKFSPLTLVTFVTLGRASYSLLAVLKKSNAVDAEIYEYSEQ